MQPPRKVDDRRDGASIGATPPPSGESALFDLPDAAPWTGSWRPLVAGWLIGLVILGGLTVFVLRFGVFEVFVTALQQADPLWLAAAAICQIGTYAAAAAVWFRILKRAGAPLRFRSLLVLALVELFANQAIPTGGLSGSLMVMQGLVRRKVAAATAMTALLVTTLSYYAAYVLVAVAAFVLLWSSGDLSSAWQGLLAICVAAVAALGIALVVLTRVRGDLIPDTILRWRPIARFAGMLDHLRFDLLHDPRLVAEAIVWQVVIFGLDATTLWCTGRAVGLHVAIGGSFTSFVLASVVATLSPTPLGLGSFEGSCTGLLHLLGGGLEASLAATLLLRGLTLWLPMLPGLWLIRREVVVQSTINSAT